MASTGRKGGDGIVQVRPNAGSVIAPKGWSSSATCSFPSLNMGNEEIDMYLSDAGDRLSGGDLWKPNEVCKIKDIKTNI